MKAVGGKKPVPKTKHRPEAHQSAVVAHHAVT